MQQSNKTILIEIKNLENIYNLGQHKQLNIIQQLSVQYSCNNNLGRYIVLFVVLI